MANTPAQRRGILSLLSSSDKRRLDVVADGRKLTVDRTGKAIQSSDGNERDQGSDQSIFDEVLTRLITCKAVPQRFRAIQRSLLMYAAGCRGKGPVAHRCDGYHH